MQINVNYFLLLCGLRVLIDIRILTMVFCEYMRILIKVLRVICINMNIISVIYLNENPKRLVFMKKFKRDIV